MLPTPAVDTANKAEYQIFSKGLFLCRHTGVFRFHLCEPNPSDIQTQS